MWLKQYIFEKSFNSEGIKCPISGRIIRRRKERLNKTQIKILNLLRETANNRIDNRDWIGTPDYSGWIHMPTLLRESKISASNWQVCEKWNLCEALTQGDDAETKCSGYWTITRKGNLFLDGDIRINKYVILYNSSAEKFEEELVYVGELCDLDKHDIRDARSNYNTPVIAH